MKYRAHNKINTCIILYPKYNLLFLALLAIICIKKFSGCTRCLSSLISLFRLRFSLLFDILSKQICRFVYHFLSPRQARVKICLGHVCLKWIGLQTMKDYLLFKEIMVFSRALSLWSGSGERGGGGSVKSNVRKHDGTGETFLVIII